MQLKLLSGKASSHSHDSKLSLQLFPRVSTAMSKNIKNLLHTYHLKDVNNIHKVFLALIILFNQFQGNNLAFSFF